MEPIKTEQTGYRKAVELIEKCLCEDGFLATPTKVDNYRRIWARDGCIIGLSALMTGNETLIEGCRKTLQTLADHQGPHGEIPSNVDKMSGRVSYGGTAGRVDSDLWFIITSAQYWRVTSDDTFLERMLDPIEKVFFLLGAWEFNTRGLLYLPLTGDWADEYLHTGYVLFDQLLYLQAQKALCAIRKYVQGSIDHELQERISRLKSVLRDNYWLSERDDLPEHVYHDVLYKKGFKARSRFANKYWAPFFSPAGYGYRFDALANIMASLLGIASREQTTIVDNYIDTEINDGKILPLPAFHPVIKPTDKDWEELQLTFSYSFKNDPYEYQNGGRWPFITGFYVVDLVKRGERDKAQGYLEAVDIANRGKLKDGDWLFPEYLHGKTLEAGGTFQLGWSAAATVMGYEALAGKPLLSVD